MQISSSIFSDYKQERTNVSLQSSKSPEEGSRKHKDEMDSLLDGVNKRTKAIKTENEKSKLLWQQELNLKPHIL